MLGQTLRMMQHNKMCFLKIKLFTNIRFRSRKFKEIFFLDVKTIFLNDICNECLSLKLYKTKRK